LPFRGSPLILSAACQSGDHFPPALHPPSLLHRLGARLLPPALPLWVIWLFPPPLPYTRPFLPPISVLKLECGACNRHMALTRPHSPQNAVCVLSGVGRRTHVLAAVEALAPAFWVGGCGIRASAGRLLQEILAARGYQVVHAPNGVEASKRARAEASRTASPMICARPSGPSKATPR